MKISWLIIAVGIIAMALGLIFHLQGQAVIGPETSFMYSNTDWITYGLEIVIVGSSIVVIGVIIKIFWKG
jgi:uncharacterized integral membrane protein